MMVNGLITLKTVLGVRFYVLGKLVSDTLLATINDNRRINDGRRPNIARSANDAEGTWRFYGKNHCRKNF